MKKELENFKKQVDEEWHRTYTLTPEAFKKLIADKVNRYNMPNKTQLNERERQALFAD